MRIAAPKASHYRRGMTNHVLPTTPANGGALGRSLAPLVLLVFFEFLAMGLPLAVLPVHVEHTLGLASLVVGLVIGTASVVTLVTRYAAGTWSDRHGPRRATVVGLAITAAAGLAYGVSAVAPTSDVSLLVLLAGRALLGLGESLVIVGALAWGVALAGRERTGVVMAWIGMAMYGALSVGAPVGAALHDVAGLLGVSLAAAVAPVVGVAAVRFARRVEPVAGARVPFRSVAAAISVPGLGLALAAFSFASVAAFASLLFVERGWPFGALPMTAFGAAYVLARLMFGGLPDRLGGPRVAAVSVALAAAGQVGLWLAPTGEIGIASAAASGFGFSLAFPAFGVEAMRRVPPQARGVALGAYVAFFDATLGVGIPMLGFVVGFLGYPTAFAVGAVASAASFVVALVLVGRPAASAQEPGAARPPSIPTRQGPSAGVSPSLPRRSI